MTETSAPLPNRWAERLREGERLLTQGKDLTPDAAPAGHQRANAESLARPVRRDEGRDPGLRPASPTCSPRPSPTGRTRRGGVAANRRARHGVHDRHVHSRTDQGRSACVQGRSLSCEDRSSLAYACYKVASKGLQYRRLDLTNSPRPGLPDAFDSHVAFTSRRCEHDMQWVIPPVRREQPMAPLELDWTTARAG